MDDNKFWVRIATILIVGILSFSGIVATHNYYTHVKMIENGYEQVTITGSRYIVWQKIK